MHVLVAVRHPEHVRFYRHAVTELRERGHRVSILARAHAATVALLDRYDLPYAVLAGEPSTTADLVAGHVRYEARTLARAVRTDADVLTSVGGRAVSHLAPLAGARSVVFVDWAPTRVDRIVARLADAVCTPAYLAGAFGDRQVVYDGLHELAYLDPERDGRPDPPPDLPPEPYAVVGVRDPAAAGAWYGPVRDRLARHGGVALVSASGTDDDVDRRYAADGAVEGVLAGATACVSALGTTATEAAVCGTPTVFVGDPPVRCRHLRDEYDLVATADAATATDRVEEVLADGSAGNRWARRRRRLLDDTDNVTDAVVAAVLGDRGPADRGRVHPGG
ncbi:MAG: hypothetical protein ABEJ81_02205 [Haloferacaceae archaeon]